jgi:hypothetical protein
VTKEELLQKLSEIEWDDFECKAAQDKMPEDVKHYGRIIYVLQQTERIMQEIDNVMHK